MKTYDIIEYLRSNSSLNKKREILREQKDNNEFKEILRYTFDPRITFGIKKIPTVTQTGDESLSWALKKLDELVTRRKTGNEAIMFLQFVLESLSEENQKVIAQVIAKDFKAGFGVSLINDEMQPFSIYTVPYMGACGYSEKVIDKITSKEYAISEVKMDGRYLNCIVRNSKVFMESRGGKPNPLMGCLEESAIELANRIGYSEVVFNGELMFDREPDRYRANGIISSFVSIAQKKHDGKNTLREVHKFEDEYEMSIEEAKSRIKLVVWDYIPYENYLEEYWSTPRHARLNTLESVICDQLSFKIIEYKIVTSKQEAIKHFQEMLARGEEGTILKDKDAHWENKKPKTQCKMKVEMNVDLVIYGFNYGTPGTKNQHLITSLNCESIDGLLKTSPGGLKEKDMKFITENQEDLLGGIVEVKCSGISQDSNGNYSLLHPVFVRIRDDKNTGDDLKSIIDIDLMVKGLKSKEEECQ